MAYYQPGGNTSLKNDLKKESLNVVITNSRSRWLTTDFCRVQHRSSHRYTKGNSRIIIDLITTTDRCNVGYSRRQNLEDCVC